MTVDASVNDATETFLQHLNGEALTDLDELFQGLLLV